MADTFTTNLNLTKPEPGAAEDTWGISLNADLDALDGLFSATGTSVAMNLDGAVIDSSVIGGTTAAAGSFTTLSASTSITGTLATAAQPNITSLGTLTGLTTTGNINFGDNDKAIFGAGSDLKMYHSGTTGTIENYTGTFLISNSSDDYDVIIQSDNGSGGLADYFRADGSAGSAILYNYGNAKLATTSTGIDVTGTVTADGLTVQGSNGNFEVATTGNSVNMTRAGNNFITASDASGDLYLGAGGTSLLKIDNGGDISFYDDTGTSQNLTWDASADTLNFVDNAKATFGTGSDLEIYHDGSNSYVKEKGNGVLNISGGNAINFLTGNDAAETGLTIATDGAVTLYHNNQPKLATTSTGIDVTGTATMDGLTVDGSVTFNTGTSTFDNVVIKNTSAGASTAPDLVLYRDSVSPADNDNIGKIDFRGKDSAASDIDYASIVSTISDATSATADGKLNFYVSTASSLNKALTIEGGDISFYDDTGTSQNLKWDASADSLRFVDNAKATFGDSNDLQIFHSSTNSHVKDAGTGSLMLQGDSLYLTNAAGGKTYFYGASSTGAAQLRYDNSPKLVTTNTGIDVTGTVTADGLTVSKAAGDIATLEGTGTTADVEANLVFNPVYDVNARIVSAREGAALASTLAFETGVDNTGSTVKRQLISSNGDISFYDDTGTSQALFWDASAERLGIGTTSPDTTLHLSASNNTSPVLRLERNDTFIVATDQYGAIEFEGQDANTNASGVRGSIRGIGEGEQGQMALTFSTASGSTSETERLRIDASGNVGIGTTSPAKQLHVYQPSGQTGIVLSRTNNIAGVNLQFSVDSSKTRLLSYGDALTFWTNSIGNGTNASERARIDSSGNVGIGTTSPSYKLSVSGNIGLTDGVSTATHTLVGGNYYIQNTGAYSTIFQTAGTERMRIDSSGNVGIGTTSPSAKLEVAGGGFAVTGNSIKTIIAYSDRGIFGTTTNHDLEIRTNNTERMRIDSSGNVGIGTSSPSTALSIESSGANGIDLEADSSATTNSNRLFFSTSAGTNSIMGVSGALTFRTGATAGSASGTERMRIDSSGNLLVGTTSTNFADQGVIINDGQYIGTMTGSHCATYNRLSTDGEIIRFYKDSTTKVGSIGTIFGDLTIGDDDVAIRFDTGTGLVPWDLGATTTGGSATNGTIDLGVSGAAFKDLHLSGQANVGSVLATGNVTAYSDERLKDNIQTLQGSKVLEMRGVSYTKDGEASSGVIAQEIEKVAPELVHTAKDEMGTKSVAYGNLVGYLIEAIKDQQKQIDDLKERLDNGTS